MTTTTPDVRAASGPDPVVPAVPRRRGRARTHSSDQPRRSRLLTVVMLLVLLYFLLPLFWLFVASTKSNADLFSTFGLWFADSSSLWANITTVFTTQDGIYLVWLRNTVVYALSSAIGAALLATMAGYAFAKYRFPGGNAIFGGILGSIMVPTTALAIPTYLLFAKAGLVNTPWAVILPSLVSPFGVYLMRVYAADAVDDTLIEAARVDGAGELRIFFQVAMRLLVPGMVTVLLFTLVATWNNYFLPLIVLNSTDLFPLTVGLAQWQATAAGGSGSRPLFSAIITGSAISIIPLVIAFLFLQRYWQSGLATGSVKG